MFNIQLHNTISPYFFRKLLIIKKETSQATLKTSIIYYKQNIKCFDWAALIRLLKILLSICNVLRHVTHEFFNQKQISFSKQN